MRTDCCRVVDQINMKAYVQATRHLVYELFDSLLALHRSGELTRGTSPGEVARYMTSSLTQPALKDMGSEFITSYTKMVDGEKDPRNLMLLFSMDRVILLEFDVRDHIDVGQTSPYHGKKASLIMA